MRIILDADVVIRGEREQFDLKGWILQRSQDRFKLAAITLAELFHGLERATSGHRRHRDMFLRSILDELPILPYTEFTASEHARIWADLESSGKMIGYYDLIVAATALEHDSAVATFNHKHFSQVRGLKIIKPA